MTDIVAVDAPVEQGWNCKRCGSSRWVAASWDMGRTRYRQCVPCGHYSDDLVPDDTPKKLNWQDLTSNQFYDIAESPQGQMLANVYHSILFGDHAVHTMFHSCSCYHQAVDAILGQW